MHGCYLHYPAPPTLNLRCEYSALNHLISMLMNNPAYSQYSSDTHKYSFFRRGVIMIMALSFPGSFALGT